MYAKNFKELKIAPEVRNAPPILSSLPSVSSKIAILMESSRVYGYISFK
jgi:hypothetical protein